MMPKHKCATVFQSMTREELLRALEAFAKNWLAHDGCWFLAAEERLGMEAAIELDARAWARFAAAEAQRIMATFDVPQNGGLVSLEKALGLRMYALINAQRAEWSEDRRRLRFFMDVCRGRKRVAARACRPSLARVLAASNSTLFRAPSIRKFAPLVCIARPILLPTNIAPGNLLWPRPKEIDIQRGAVYLAGYRFVSARGNPTLCSRAPVFNLKPPPCGSRRRTG